MSSVIYVPRTLGSVLILTINPPTVVLPTVFIVANFRAGATQTVFRNGQVTTEGR